MSNLTTVTPEDLAAFVVHEARLLDERRYDEWYALFAEEGRYWIPLQHGQADPLTHNSLMYEDRLLLRLRIDRLSHARAFSQQPASRCLHVLQAPQVEQVDPAGRAHCVRTPFMYLEARGEAQLVLGAVAWHTLAADADGTLRIVQKRVDLLNCDAALPSIQLFL